MRFTQSCHNQTPLPTGARPINPYIWCATGGIVGYLFGIFLQVPGGRREFTENILVGIFGAFLGGDFLVSQLHGGVVNDTVFSFSSLGFAIGGAVALVLILRIIRKAVGPTHTSKSKSRDLH